MLKRSSLITLVVASMVLALLRTSSTASAAQDCLTIVVNKQEVATYFDPRTGVVSTRVEIRKVRVPNPNCSPESPSKPAAPAPAPVDPRLPANAVLVLNKPSIFAAECWIGNWYICTAPLPGQPARPAPPTRAEVESVARSLLGRLQIPEATPFIGPDPAVNEWGMAVVGYPLWLWTPAMAPLSTTVSGQGLTIAMAAQPVATTFSMGDGRSVTCASTQPYPAGTTPGTPSPVCGHVYESPSLPKGTYTVTATTQWSVAWSALGYSGTLPVSRTASRPLPVGELQAVVVG